MCGIVGYSGRNDGINIVLEGLSRLEYRGYDSSGIAFKNEDLISIYKKEGGLQNLKKLLLNLDKKPSLVIGHTRWATHGKVNDINAHPHGDETLSIVHNGIIENAAELRSFLKKEGYDFKSETDSEVFYVLLRSVLKNEENIKKAITKAFSLIKGNSAFVIISSDQNAFYSIKRGAPLVCGLNSLSSEVFVSSDPYALVGFLDKLYFPEDEVLCVGCYEDTQNQLAFYEMDGSISSRYKLEASNHELEISSKGSFEHFMLKEIFEQPSLIRSLVSKYNSKDKESFLKRIKSFKPKHIHIIGCGTAWHAGLVIKNFIEEIARIRVSVELASEFRYRNPILKKDELALFISQSGETADTLACQELCKSSGIKTYSIVNVEGSTLFRNSDENFLIYAGREIGVASTKAFTQQVLVGYLLALLINDSLDFDSLNSDLLELSNKIQSLLLRTEEISEVASSIYQKRGFLFTGRGNEYPIALEGALKLKEIAYVHAEGYAAGELKHGPISLVDEAMVNFAIITPDLFDKTYSNAEEVKARRGILVTFGDQNNQELKDFSDYFIGGDFSFNKRLAPLYTNVMMQLVSYYIAKLKGTDIDKPRNLAKSVTVE